MADQLKQGDVLRLEINPQYAQIRIVPNGTEGQDPNFPRNLHNAAELFLKLGMVPQAVKLKDCTDPLLELYAAGPGGRTGVRLGRACVCWQCGACGIPQDYQDDDDEKSQKPPGPCFQCGETNQINWVRVTQPSGEDLPWMTVAPRSKEQEAEMKQQQEVELAARRAAVEARVAQALKEREEAAKEGK